MNTTKTIWVEVIGDGHFAWIRDYPDGVVQTGDVNHLEDDMSIYGKDAAQHIAEVMDNYVVGQYMKRVNIEVQNE